MTEASASSGGVQSIDSNGLYSVLAFDTEVPFITGDEVIYRAGTASTTLGMIEGYTGVEEGRYFVEVQPDPKKIKLCVARSFIDAQDYVKFASLPSAYRTASIYGDFQFLRNWFRSGWMGLGGVILQDAAGGNTLVSNKLYTSIAYHQMLGEEGLLSLGFNVGFANKRINTTDLRFGDQWNALSKDFNIPTPYESPASLSPVPI